MKIAYLILAHTNIEQVYSLIDVLDYENAYFFIHLKKGYDIVLDKNYLAKRNVVFSPVRYKSGWCGCKVTLATLHLMQLAANSVKNIDFMILLSGHCYPIKSNANIFNFIKNNKEKLFIETIPLPDKKQKNAGLHKVEYHWYMDELNDYNSYLKWTILRTIHFFEKMVNYKRKYPKGFSPYFGSQWWGLPRFAIEHILKISEKRKDFLKFHKRVFCSDELYIQTIIGNSPYKKQITNQPFRYIDWENAEKNGSPKIMRIDDFEILKNSEHLFARKFDVNLDNKIINKIKSDILHNTT